MDTKYSENSGKKVHTGVGNLFITLVRKNQDEVEVALTDGRVLSGYIDAFDEQGIVIGCKTTPYGNSETYVTRQQIVTITPKSPVCYLTVI